jgi:LCP family protein required for cell wall assembly
MAFFNGKKGIISICFIVFIATAGIGAFLGGQLNNVFFESAETKGVKGKAINILFMGIDARDAKSNSRSDTMIMASIDPNTKKTALVSIPRDTRIKNSSGKYDKINSVNFLDGPEAACKEVAKLLSVPVDYYVVTNFAGFGEIVDALGGVHINVESAMRHADPINPELAINIPKGNQYLNGKQALGFVRYRGGPTADIGRTENQQKFIKALAAEMLQSKTIVKLPQLIPQINKNVRTNLPLKDMIYLANLAKDIDVASLSTQTLPGYFLHDNATGASYWEADKKVAAIIVESLLKGETFKVVSDTPAALNQGKTSVVSAVPVQEKKETLPVQDTLNKTDSKSDTSGNTVDKDGKKSTTPDNENADKSNLTPSTDKNQVGPVSPTPSGTDQSVNKSDQQADKKTEQPEKVTTQPNGIPPAPLVLN